ncbi:DUF3791 domain-containing protein [Actinobacillus porcinus]|nr:DUF3791 domain-containing protein [Actinobacillus porcinus]MCI5764814.1 DUF3791 domain-containing protein [Actinobacillus porcinus]MDD7544003.1 DUF3791 domain-containing protein [Actinobacillus porcinus]MDY5848626.1 DUF3791 domain-containing protein [Actinobacillus porcinus]
MKNVNAEFEIHHQRELEFALFCIDFVAKELNIPAKLVYQKLAESGLLQDYIIANYEMLHTLGKDYLVSDIIGLMRERSLFIKSTPHLQRERKAMMASPVLLQRKYARIIALLAEQLHISLAESLDRFMFSKTYELMSEGVADMHCLSDGYLVEEIIREQQNG